MASTVDEPPTPGRVDQKSTPYGGIPHVNTAKKVPQEHLQDHYRKMGMG
jgi:hypothetical protein